MFINISDYFDSTPRGPCPRNHISNCTCSTSLIARYIKWFTGACFDPRIDEPWWHANRFNSSDMYAVAALGMSHMIHPKKMNAFCEIFEQDADAASDCATPCMGHLTCLLQQIPVEADIWDPSASRYIDLGVKLRELLRCSRPYRVGDIGINKLVSRKRPRLLPVVDSVSMERMRCHNGGHKPKKYWQCFHDELNPLSTALSSAIGDVRKAAEVPAWTSDIRVIDIAIWMKQMYPC